MPEWLNLVALAGMPAVGFLLGVGAAELYRAPLWLIGAALHAAAGIAVAVIAFELAPRALAAPMTWFVLALVAGGAVALSLNAAAHWAQQGFGAGRGALMVYVAVGADLLSDGLMTGAATAVEQRLGFLLAASQLAANVPGGFSAAANLRAQMQTRMKRIALAFLTAACPVLFGALVGYFALRGASEAVKAVALAGVIGLLLAATVEDLVPQADRPNPPRVLSTGALIGGFCLFAVLSQLSG